MLGKYIDKILKILRMVFRMPGLMITVSHQTFSSQLWHLTDQTKIDQTNLLCIINGEVNKFTIGKQMSGQFSTLIISTEHRMLVNVLGLLYLLNNNCIVQ